ncbi:MAG TPA: hypothetical protein PLP01_12295, partial [Phycisphaerae bacterium]|nr:hypothetical protein [Phycisphaerae bacterium]
MKSSNGSSLTRSVWRTSLWAFGVAIALAGTAMAQVDNTWTQYHQGPGFAGQSASGPDLRDYPTARFVVGAGLGAGFMGASVSSPVVMNNQVYCYDAEGGLFAFSE